MVEEALLSPPAERCFTLYGLTIGTRTRFEAPLAAGRPPIDLTLRVDDRPPRADRFAGASPLYRSPVPGPDGRSRFELLRVGDRERMRFVGRVDFDLAPGRITARPHGAAGRREIEGLLLGSVAAYLLERRGVVALHASAVAVDGRAVALMADSGGGKSSLATALVLAGAELLTDDILAIEAGDPARVRPGIPLLKVGDAVGAALLGERFERLPRLEVERRRRAVRVGGEGLGRFGDRPAPLAAVYLPVADRRIERPRIEPLTPREALVEALRHTFTPRLVAGVGLDGARLERLGAVVERVPFRRLRVPWRIDRLPEVAAEVAADLDRRAMR